MSDSDDEMMYVQDGLFLHWNPERFFTNTAYVALSPAMR